MIPECLLSSIFGSERTILIRIMTFLLLLISCVVWGIVIDPSECQFLYKKVEMERLSKREKGMV